MRQLGAYWHHHNRKDTMHGGFRTQTISATTYDPNKFRTPAEILPKFYAWLGTLAPDSDQKGEA